VVQDTVLCRKAINLMVATLEPQAVPHSIRLIELQHVYLTVFIFDPSPGPDVAIYYILDRKLEKMLDPKCPGHALCRR
jgi:hypothetical protein